MRIDLLTGAIYISTRVIPKNKKYSQEIVAWNSSAVVDVSCYNTDSVKHSTLLPCTILPRWRRVEEQSSLQGTRDESAPSGTLQYSSA